MAVVNTMSVPSKVIEGSFEFGGPYLRMRWRWNQAHTAREIQVIEQTARGVGFGLDPTVDPREFYRAGLGTLRSGHESGPCLDSAVGRNARFFVRGDNLELDYKVFELASLDTFETLRHLVSAYNHAVLASLPRSGIDGVVTGRASSKQPSISNLPKGDAQRTPPNAVQTQMQIAREEAKDAQHCNLKQAATLAWPSPSAEVQALQAQLAAARADADRLRGGRTERKTFLMLTPVPGRASGEGKDHLIQIGDNVEHLVIIHDPNCHWPERDHAGTTTFVRVHTGIECTVVKVER